MKREIMKISYTPEYHRMHVKKIAAEKIKYCRAYKAEKGCVVCGEKDPIILCFHHKDRGSKSEQLMYASKNNKSAALYRLGWDKMMEEIEKCDVMCANCHVRHEYFVNNNFKKEA